MSGVMVSDYGRLCLLDGEITETIAEDPVSKNWDEKSVATGTNVDSLEGCPLLNYLQNRELGVASWKDGIRKAVESESFAFGAGGKNASTSRVTELGNQRTMPSVIIGEKQGMVHRTNKGG